MNRTVRYDARNDIWTFGNEIRSSNGADSLVIKEQDLPVSSATDLAHALRKARENQTAPEAVFIDLAPDDYYSPKESVVDEIYFTQLNEDTLAVAIPLTNDIYIEEDEQLRSIITPLLDPLLKRLKVRLAEVRADSIRSTAPYFHEAYITTSTRGKTLAQLYDIADNIKRILEASSTGRFTRETIVDLILGGKGNLLLDFPEGPWIDVKSQHYDLTTARGKISLAESVSRFCNAEEGGVVIVGFDTKRTPGGEIIKSMKPAPIDSRTTRKYRQSLEGRIFPFPSGLNIDIVEASPGSGLVVISVPPQEEENKPFLVHGAIVGNRVEGAYISIVRRSGEDSIPITAQQIHSTLAAGRALLRRGQLPPTRN